MSFLLQGTEEPAAVIAPEKPASGEATAGGAEPVEAGSEGVAEGEQPELEAGAEGEQPDGEIDPEDQGIPVDLENIEIDGKTYSVPKDLKSAFLKSADYTQKTQEVAEARRQVEARAKELEEQTAARDTDFEGRVQLHVVDSELKTYENVDWNKLQSDDPVLAQQHWMRFTSLKDAKRELSEKLTRSEGERTEKAQRDHATRIQDTQRTVQREIKGWGPELAGKLTTYGLSQGFTQDELLALNTDPRLIKVLHAAYVGADLLKKAAAPRKPGTPIVVKPLTQTNRGTPRPATMAPSDKDDDATWLRKREAQLRKKQA